MSLKGEQILQINFINWFVERFPEFEHDIHHFANERKCSVFEGRILKRMGVRRGVGQIFIALPRNHKSGLWIEFKVGNNKPDHDQMAFLARKTVCGYVAICVWDLETAQNIVETYLI